MWLLGSGQSEGPTVGSRVWVSARVLAGWLAAHYLSVAACSVLAAMPGSCRAYLLTTHRIQGGGRGLEDMNSVLNGRRWPNLLHRNLNFEQGREREERKGEVKAAAGGFFGHRSGPPPPLEEEWWRRPRSQRSRGFWRRWKERVHGYLFRSVGHTTTEIFFSDATHLNQRRFT